MRKNLQHIGLSAILGLSVMLSAVSAQQVAPSVIIYGVTTDGKLVAFDSGEPAKLLVCRRVDAAHPDGMAHEYEDQQH